MPLFFLLAASSAFAAPSVVSVSQSADGTVSLVRNGKPYFVKGGGGQRHLDVLAACGGNSIRTWGVGSMDELVDGKPLLDRAQELGISVTVGLWVQHERHGADYSNAAKLAEQRESIRQAVRKYKDHPAVLMWGLGNEMEGPISGGGNPKVWEELNVLAGIVKQEDPNHPIMTAIAGAAEGKVKGILAHYSNLDILGVNAYSGASGTGKTIQRAGWTKGFLLTEFGTPGHWEVAKTSWGAPIEPSSWDKAASYYATQTGLVENSPKTCLGSYAFVWGQKQETTSTWYGMFLENGEKLPSVDGMARAWMGRWPANRSPKISAFKFPLKDGKIAAGQSATASIEVTDAEKDPLTYDWLVVAESTDTKVGGDKERVPPSFPDCVTGRPTTEATVKANLKPGAYRLFVTVHDGRGGASRDNIPFLVTPTAPN